MWIIIVAFYLISNTHSRMNVFSLQYKFISIIVEVNVLMSFHYNKIIIIVRISKTVNFNECISCLYLKMFGYVFHSMWWWLTFIGIFRLFDPCTKVFVLNTMHGWISINKPFLLLLLSMISDEKISVVFRVFFSKEKQVIFK